MKRRTKTTAGLLSLAALLSFCRQSDNEGKQVHLLKPGQAYQGRIVAGASEEVLHVCLQKGEFVQIDAEQVGIDLEASLFDPDGNLLLKIDNPSGTLGSESLWVIAQQGGEFALRLEVSNKAIEGRFDVRINPLSIDLKELADASRMISEGDRLRHDNEQAKALEKYSAARALWKKHHRRREESFALARIGFVYFATGEIRQAFDSLEAALEVMDENVDYAAAVHHLIFMAQICRDSGDKEASAEYVQHALRISRQAEYEHGIALSLSELTKNLIEKGRYQEAVLPSKEALEIWDSGALNPKSIELRIHLARMYCSLGRKGLAFDHLETALNHAQELGNDYWQASAQTWIGWAHYLDGAIEQAILAGEQALELRVDPSALQLVGISHWTYGEQFERNGDNVRAQEHFRKSLKSLNLALQYVRDRNWKVDESNFLAHIARTQLSLHQPDLALQTAKEALAIIAHLDAPEVEMFSLFVESKAHFERGSLAEARRSIEEALGILQGLQEQAGTSQSQIPFLDLRYRMHEHHLQVLMELQQRKPEGGFEVLALEANDRSRTRSFLQSMAEAGAEIRRTVDPNLLQENTQAQQRLSQKERERRALLQRPHSAEELASINQQIRGLQEACDQVAARIRFSHPKYAEMSDPNPIGLEEMQRSVLDSETLLLIYAFGDRDLFAWLVGQDFVRSFNLGKREPIEKLSRQFVDAFKQPTSLITRDGRLDHLNRLSSYLIGPLKEQLGSFRLAIVADGPLHYVPFNFLQTTSGEKGKFGRPLIADHEIVMLPSVSALAAVRARAGGRQSATRTIVVLSDPVFNAKDERLRQILGQEVPKEGLDLADAAGIDVSQLKRLGYTREEGKAILAMVSPQQGKDATGFEASKQMLKQLGGYRILHFATHAIIYPENPDLSSIVLSTFDEAGQPQDGIVQAHEIYGLDLSTDLVVLSACETARGEIFRGEGIVGFTRAFMFAGAPRIVVSLWKVSDEATSELMTAFYKYLFDDDDTPSAALRKAQLSLIESDKWADPYYWGAFVLEGEWRNHRPFSAKQD